MATAGSYRIWTADKDGNVLDGPDPANPNKHPFPNPADTKAVDIYFGLDSSAPQPPPKDQVDLQADIEKLLSTVRRLFHDRSPPWEGKFRRYYIRLFRLTQLGLEGSDASPEVARGALAAVTTDLIDDEAGRVKNGHLGRLGRLALLFALPFALAYLALCLADSKSIETVLSSLGIVRAVAANFMLLWMGCFLGVWLSYGIRTAVFTLSDLTSTDNDRLLPHLRLAFAGTLTMIIGLLFVLGIVEVKVGGYLVTEIDTRPTLAFLVGVFCGISELTLPSSVAKKAKAFSEDVK